MLEAKYLGKFKCKNDKARNCSSLQSIIQDYGKDSYWLTIKEVGSDGERIEYRIDFKYEGTIHTKNCNCEQFSNLIKLAPSISIFTNNEFATKTK